MARRILSLDGGGIKGTFTVAFLAAIEKKLRQPIGKYFDLIAGTSTGGIIALGLSIGVPARTVLELYRTKGPRIFPSASLGVTGAFRNFKTYFCGPKYNSQHLKAALKDVLNDHKLGNAKTRLLIPAFDNNKQQVHIFKTAHHPRFEFDHNMPMVDVALATASAPTYFKQHRLGNQMLLTDGGVWANNPIGLAVVEALGTLGWKPNELSVLSIGCSDSHQRVELDRGIFRLLPNLQDLFMAGQHSSSMGTAKILTGVNTNAIHRISPGTHAATAMDETSSIPDLISAGASEARCSLPNLRPLFFENTAEPFTPHHE